MGLWHPVRRAKVFGKISSFDKITSRPLSPSMAWEVRMHVGSLVTAANG